MTRTLSSSLPWSITHHTTNITANIRHDGKNSTVPDGCGGVCESGFPISEKTLGPDHSRPHLISNLNLGSFDLISPRTIVLDDGRPLTTDLRFRLDLFDWILAFSSSLFDTTIYEQLRKNLHDEGVGTRRRRASSETQRKCPAARSSHLAKCISFVLSRYASQYPFHIR